MSWYETAMRMDLSPGLFSYVEYRDSLLVKMHWRVLEALVDSEEVSPRLPVNLHLVVNDNHQGTCPHGNMSLSGVEQLVLINEASSQQNFTMNADDVPVVIYSGFKKTLSTLERLRAPGQTLISLHPDGEVFCSGRLGIEHSFITSHLREKVLQGMRPRKIVTEEMLLEECRENFKGLKSLYEA